MDITVSEKYLWFPVDMSGEMVWVSVYDGDQKIQEMKVSLGKEHIDFYGVWKATEYLGKELRIVSEKGEEYLDGVDIRQEKTRPQNDYPYRPRLHYTPAYGWVNDPNGLVYVDGVYHMFHQYNPYSTEWQNMSWGHATSTDLMHWEEQEVASTPDEYGTMYSGCALVDEKNTAGYGKDALLFFYTAAGGMNEWSKEAGNLFTQKLMWSTDGTKTLHKRDEELVPWIVGENRDPKVFWHAESNAYVMIMYLEENDFLILRSADLLHWEQTQKMTVPGMWECPLLIEVPVEGTDKKEWVFWSADGYYQIGSFDGYTFQTKTERKMAYFSRRAYAAQNFVNVGERVLLVPWVRLDNANGWYRGAMGIPQEICLKDGADGLQLAFSMAEELHAMRGSWEVLPQNETIFIAGEARTDKKEWVFWSADGYYQIGSFDGYTFQTKTERKMAYFSRRAYAAQNFVNVGERVLLVPWVRLDNANGWYRGAMGIPQEICLKDGADGLQLAFSMTEELHAMRGSWEVLPQNETISIAGEAREVVLSWNAGMTGTELLEIGETTIRIDFTHGELWVDTDRKHELDGELRGVFDPAKPLDMTVVIDQEMLDILADGGRLCGTIETEENVLGKTLKLHGDAAPEAAKWCVLK